MSSFNFGRLLIMFGVTLLVLGLIITGLGKFLNLGRLPGDVLIKKGNVTFFLPIVTSIILSLILSLLLNLLVRR